MKKADPNIFLVRGWRRLETHFLSHLSKWRRSDEAARELVKDSFLKNRAAADRAAAEGDTRILVTSLHFDEDKGGRPKLVVLGPGKESMSYKWKPDEVLRIHFGFGQRGKILVRVRAPHISGPPSQ